MSNRRTFVRFTKVDEEKREVAGRLTQEVVDRDGEIWDYESSVPHFKAWSESFAEATDGKSLGNLRAMHQPISAGKVTEIVYNEDEKAIDIVAKVVDDTEWDKVKEGLYTGFSVGGRVVKSWRDGSEPKYKRFEVKPIEASLADMPCVPTATFSYIKADGVETRPFKKVIPMKPSIFADAANRRFPVDTKGQTQVSIAAFAKTAARAKYSADEQAKVVTELAAAAAKHGLENVTEKVIAGGEFAKGLYDVSRFCDVIQSLAYLQQSAAYEREYEGDDSTVPDSIRDAIASLVASLETMVGEEGDELLRMLGFEVAEADSAAAAQADAKKTAGTEAPAAADPATPPAPASAASAESAAAATDGTPPVTEKVAAAADTTSGSFEKAMAKKHQAKLAELSDHVAAVHKMLGDHCEKMAGFCKDMGADGGDDVEETAKAAGADTQKLTGQVADFEKRAKDAESARDEAYAKIAALESELTTVKAQAEQLAKIGEEVSAALEVRKGQLIAVDRTQDGAAALSLKTETPEPAKTDTPAASNTPPGEVDRTAFSKAIGTAIRNPGFGVIRRVGR